MDKELDLVGTIINESLSDSENESLRLLNLYNKSTVREKSLIDEVIMCICGWRLETIAKIAERNGSYIQN